eukprot:9809917-Lingulodinium_polyedra.AAC.1
MEFLDGAIGPPATEVSVHMGRSHVPNVVFERRLAHCVDVANAVAHGRPLRQLANGCNLHQDARQ